MLITVIATIVVLVVAKNSDQTAFSANAPKIRTVRKVSRLLSGIPQNGNTLGQPTAPVTLQIFGDLQCLSVKNFVKKDLPAIIHNFVRTNVLKIQYRSYQTDTLNPKVFVAQQVAALAAGAQNKMWNFIETFYYEQKKEYTGYVTENYLDGIASQVPALNAAQWVSDRQKIHFFNDVVKDNRTFKAWHFHTTPSFLLGDTGGKMTRLLGFQTRESPGFEPTKYPISTVNVKILRKAIERLP